MRVHEVISKNLDTFNALVKAGAVSLSFMNYFEIYRAYQGSKGIKSKMDRYYYVAKSTRNNMATVRRAISIMEKTA